MMPWTKTDTLIKEIELGPRSKCSHLIFDKKCQKYTLGEKTLTVWARLAI